MGKVVTLAETQRAVAAARERGAKVALANGAFDLLHVGHVRYLQGAKAFADVLVVAVNADVSVRRAKGPTRPAVPEAERAEIVAALGAVDWVVVFSEDTVQQVIEALHPDFHVKGTDYTPESVPEARWVRAYGGQVVIAGDPKNHSTTVLLGKLNNAQGG